MTILFSFMILYVDWSPLNSSFAPCDRSGAVVVLRLHWAGLSKWPPHMAGSWYWLSPGKSAGAVDESFTQVRIFHVAWASLEHGDWVLRGCILRVNISVSCQPSTRLLLAWSHLHHIPLVKQPQDSTDSRRREINSSYWRKWQKFCSHHLGGSGLEPEILHFQDAACDV